MKIGLFFLLTATGASFGASAAEPTPNLPPTEVVARVLRANPTVQAASGQVRVEEANRNRLEAGPYEWNLRFGANQRRVYPAAGNDERYNEWNAQLERPLRLPGKSSADAELGDIREHKSPLFVCRDIECVRIVVDARKRREGGADRDRHVRA